MKTTVDVNSPTILQFPRSMSLRGVNREPTIRMQYCTRARGRKRETRMRLVLTRVVFQEKNAHFEGPQT